MLAAEGQQPSRASSRAGREWLFGLFTLALIPRLILIASRPDGLEFWEYEDLARSIISGQGYVISRFGHQAFAFGDGNLYSFLAASVYLLVGHEPRVLGVIQAALASLAPPLIFAIGLRAFSRQVALLGAVLAALHPGLLAYTMKLHPLGLDVLLLALMVWWFGRTDTGKQQGLGAGLALGMALMSRPTFFLAGVIALAYRWRNDWRRPVIPMAAVMVALVIASPWVVRNWTVLGRPVFISTSLEDVWKGNNPLSTGSSYLPNGQAIFSAVPPEIGARFQQDSELALNDVFGQEVLAFVNQQPVDFIGLVTRKFVYFWWLSPQAGVLYPSTWLAAYEVYAAAVLSLALVGVLAIVRCGTAAERNLLGMLAAISLTLAVVHSMAYVEGRHRWGVEPLLLLLTARGLFVVARAMLMPVLGDQWRGFRRLSER
jgi:hypothetical protein